MEVSYVQIVNNTGVNWKVTAVDITKSQWEGKYDPETQLKDACINAGGTLRRKLQRRSSKGGYTVTLANMANSAEKMDIYVEQSFGQREYYKESTVQATGTGTNYISVQSVSWYKEENEGRGTRNVFLRSKDSNVKDNKTVQFYVLGDTHLTNDDDDNAACCSAQIRDHMMATADFPKYRYTFIVGDLVEAPSQKAPDRYTDIWQCAKRGYSPLLCDGYGNHDMQQMNAAHADIAQLIRDRNNTRAAAGLEGFVTNTVEGNPSASGLHYKWHTILSSGSTSVKVHFFMLNLVPTAGCNSSRNKNSSYALDFLQDHLPKDGDTILHEPVFLFHHYGFADPNAGCIYWNADEKKTYVDALKGYPLAGIFYGHWHYTRNDKDRRKTDAPNITLTDNNAFCCGGVQDDEKLRYVRVRAAYANNAVSVKVEKVNADNNKTETLGDYTLSLPATETR